MPSNTVSIDSSSSTRKTNSVPSMEPFRYGVLTSKPRGLRLNDWKAPFSRLSTERSSADPADVVQPHGGILVDTQHGLVDERHRGATACTGTDRVTLAKGLIQCSRLPGRDARRLDLDLPFRAGESPDHRVTGLCGRQRQWKQKKGTTNCRAEETNHYLIPSYLYRVTHFATQDTRIRNALNHATPPHVQGVC